MKGIIGKKVGMTQVYDAKGTLVPVTVIEAGPCVVLDVKTQERDGYSAVQVGFGSRKAKNVSKQILGSVAKAGQEKTPPAVIKEFRLDGEAAPEIGSLVKADIFSEGEYLDITGVTKGKGYNGVMVRHHFKGGRDGHGGGWHRKPGSIGCRESPGNIVKGKPMAGQLGNASRTVQNLRIVSVSAEENLLFVRGAVPGPNGGTVFVRKAIKK
jgi:large subunit ribosomal protein L3